MQTERESLDALYKAAHDMLAVRVELPGNTIKLDDPAVKALAAAYVAEKERRDFMGFDAEPNQTADALGSSLVVELMPYLRRLAGKMAYSVAQIKRLTELAPASATLTQFEAIEAERGHILNVMNDAPILKGTRVLAEVLNRADQWRTAVIGAWAQRAAEGLNAAKPADPWANQRDTPSEAAARSRLREILSWPRRAAFTATAHYADIEETVTIENHIYPSSKYSMRDKSGVMVGAIDAEYYPADLDKMISRIRYPAAILTVIAEHWVGFAADVMPPF